MSDWLRPAAWGARKPRLARLPGGVYFIQCGAFTKIGHASDLNERLNALAAMIPFAVTIVRLEPFVDTAAARQREKQLHQRFAIAHHRGEWFATEPEIAT